VRNVFANLISILNASPPGVCNGRLPTGDSLLPYYRRVPLELQYSMYYSRNA
jgi:hypothetical protein